MARRTALGFPRAPRACSLHLLSKFHDSVLRSINYLHASMCALRAHLVARGLSRAGQILTPSLARTHAHGCHKDVHVDRIICGPCANINREIACEQNEPISGCPLLIEITMRIPGRRMLSNYSHHVLTDTLMETSPRARPLKGASMKTNKRA